MSNPKVIHISGNIFFVSGGSSEKKMKFVGGVKYTIFSKQALFVNMKSGLVD